MQNGTLIKGIAVLVVIGGIVGFLVWPSKDVVVDQNISNSNVEVTKETSGSTTSAAQTATDTTIVTTQPSENNSQFKDGSYTSEGNYTSPAGPEAIKVTLTLSNGVITNSTVVSEATATFSKRYQGMFVDNYKQYVIGKNIDSLKLDKVSGSSLTPKGFNDAVAKIKVSAKA